MQPPLLGAPSSRGPRDRPYGRLPRSPPARSEGEAASHARPGGAGAPGCPTRLGSATSQTSGIRSIRTAKGREQEAAPRHRRGGGARPPTGFLGSPGCAIPEGPRSWPAPPPRVPGASRPGGTPKSSGCATHPRIRVLRLRHNRGSTGPGLLHTKRSISQSSGCATLQGPRGLALDIPRVPGSWPKSPAESPGPDLSHPGRSPGPGLHLPAGSPGLSLCHLRRSPGPGLYHPRRVPGSRPAPPCRVPQSSGCATPTGSPSP